MVATWTARRSRKIFFLGLFTNEIYLTHFLFRFGFSAMRRLFAKSTTFLSSGVTATSLRRLGRLRHLRRLRRLTDSDKP